MEKRIFIIYIGRVAINQTELDRVLRK
jgi:hypothetical protein